MKKHFNIKTLACGLLLTAMFTMNACKKDTDGSPQIKPGNLMADAIAPDSAAGGALLTLTGSGLGDIRSIVFSNDSVPAPFYSTLNTETALVFRVPDTASGGDQNIIFTNSTGKTLVVPFKVLAYPNVTSAFPTDFEQGTNVTLTGNNLADVSKVVIEGTTDEATIVSQSKKQMVIQMPASSVNRGFLRITNASGDIVTTQEFTDVTNATQVFTEDFVNPAQSWSWGGEYTPSADVAITGAKSLKAAYDPAGAWGGLQIGMGSELMLPSGTKYVSFWVKGADEDKNVTFQVKGNYWSTDNAEVITVPANKWTYFRKEISSFMPGVSSVSVIVFQIHDAGKTLYFDNIMFVK